MSAVSAVEMGSGEPFTVTDLDAMPEDGHRRELIDGVLIVSPGPSLPHQRYLRELAFHLRPLATGSLEMLWAPFDVRTSSDTNLQPDLLIARRGDLTDANLPVAPVLVVEILSPSTQHVDRALKKSKYEELGTPHYWILDPVGPSITAWELVEGSYVEAGHAAGDEALVLTRPFEVRIVPGELVS